MEFTGIDTPLRRGNMTHHHHQFALHSENEPSILLIIAEHRPHDTQMGIELVNQPVSLDARVILGDPHPVA